ncbi:MAG: peroxiredoxin [Gammaproteobacteria bacterium]|jgi:peroxiredoxin|nr:peroxiredoxin [Gammaproteobacteria bacterium]
MSIKEGDRVPDVKIKMMGEKGPTDISTGEIFGGKKVVFFAVPGAFTPTCSQAHLPGFVALADKIKAKGVDTIACMSVNDAFVMDCWGKEKNAEELLMLADWNADLTRALGLDFDASAPGLGVRCQRFAMIVDDGVVTKLAVEAPGKLEVSKAEAILEAL